MRSERAQERSDRPIFGRPTQFLLFTDPNTQVAMLLHTSIQVYTRSIWEQSVKTVSAEVTFSCSCHFLYSFTVQDRGFKVGLAIEFPDAVFAFLTFDLMFQVSV
jgi:hypothetical protein